MKKSRQFQRSDYANFNGQQSAEAKEKLIVSNARNDIMRVLQDSPGITSTLLFNLKRIVQQTIDQSNELGHELRLPAQGLIQGAIQSTKDLSTDTFELAQSIAASTVTATVRAGGELGSAVRGLLIGAEEAAELCMLSPERTISAVAQGALSSASKISDLAVSEVRDVLMRTQGNEACLEEPLPQRSYPSGIRGHEL